MGSELGQRLSSVTDSQLTVLCVEAVETVKGISVRMHIERIDGQIIGGEVERLEHLTQAEILVVPENDALVWTPLHLGLDEA